MGWNFAFHIATYHDVHVLVEKDEFETSIRDFTSRYPDKVKNLTFHFIRRKHHNLLRKIWPPSYYWFYRLWLRHVYEYAQALHQKEKFDVVHQITLAGFREPGYLWKLPIPFIWGPIGGFTQTPWCLIPGCGLYGWVYFSARNILNTFQKKYGYAGSTVAHKAHSILVSDNQGLSDVRKFWGRDAIHMLEIGTRPSSTGTTIPQRQPHDAFRICWAGQLIPLKALELLLHALHKCQDINVELDVIGDGSCKNKWQKLANKLNIADRVHFHGLVTRDEVQTFMRNSHLFCHTSIKEGGTGTVILEALQNALPVLILNHGGAALVIDDTCGIKIPITTRRQISTDIAKSIKSLAADDTKRIMLARGALKRALQFSWEKKMVQLNQIYQAATPLPPS